MSAPLAIPQTAEAEVYENLPPWLERRPTKRSECPPPDQQCPWVSCRYHLALDVRNRRLAKAPRITHNLPPDPNDWPADAKTCALHVADGGAHTLEQLGAAVGDISRERARQIEQAALDKLAAFGIVLDLGEDLGLDTNTRAPAHKRPSAEAKGHHGPRTRDTDPDLDGTYTGAFRSQTMTAKVLRIKAESAAPHRTLSPADISLAELEAQIIAKRHGRPAPSPRKPDVAINVFAQRAAQRAAKDAMQTAPPASAPSVRLDRVGAPGEPSVLMQPRVFVLPTPSITPDETPSPTSPPCPPSNLTPPSIEMPLANAAEATPPAPPVSPPDDQPKAVEVVEAVSSIPLSRSHPARRDLKGYARTASARLREILDQRGVSRGELIRLVRDTYPTSSALTVETSVDRALSATISPRSVWYRRLATALGLALSDLCGSTEWVMSVTSEDAAYVRSAYLRLATPSAPPPPTVASPEVAPPTLPPNPQITAPQIEAPKDLPQIEAAPPTPPTHRPLEDLARAAQTALAHCVSLTADAEGLRARVSDLETHNTYLRDRVATLEARLQRIAGEARL